MKKLLLASTALVLSAGLAQAQAVRITGEGRMGIEYSSAGYALIGGASNWIQESRLQLNFNVSVEADHGLTFGAFTRARMANGANGGAIAGALTPDGLGIGVFSSARVWVEANGFRLTFGNVDGAFRGAGASHGYLGGCGVGYEGGIACGDASGLLGVTQGFDSIYSPTSPVHATSRVRVDYTMGDTRVALSYDRSRATEIGIRHSFGAFTVALGYTNGNGNGAAGGWVAGQAVTAVSGHYNAGSWGAGALVAFGGGNTNYSVSGNVALGGGTVYGYIGRVGGAQTYGLDYGYGLGGGATAHAGVEHNNGTGVTVGSIGVVFGF